MKKTLQQASILFEQGRFEDALELYQNLLMENPDDVDCLCQAARCLLRLEMYGKASEYVSAAVGAAPDYAYAYYLQAHIFLSRKLPEEARRSIATALELSPTDPDYLVMLGRIESHHSDWIAVLEVADSALEASPHHLDARVLKASALVKLRRREEAASLLRDVLETDAQNQPALVELGNLYLYDGAWQEALEVFQSVLELDPESEAAREGFMNALRAKFPVYGLILRYFLWMQRFSRRYQQAIMYGASLLGRILSAIKKSHPGLAPLLGFVLLLWRVFSYLTWTVQAATTLLLRMNKFGRSLVSKREVWESNLVGGLWLAAGACALYHNIVDPFTIFCRIGMPLFLTLPMVVAGSFAVDEEGWPQHLAHGILAVMGISGIAGLFLWTFQLPLGLSLLKFYFSGLQIVLLVLAYLEGVELERR